MPRHLAIFAACLAVAHAAEPKASPAKPPADAPKRLPAVSLLPNDSRLKDVMIPRYDKDRNLLAVLRAAQMRIVDADNVSGSTVKIELHRPEGGLRGVIDLQQARIDQKSGLLHGQEHVAIRSDTMKATGSGVVYELERSRGFLLGPATTLFYPRPPATSMSRPSLHPSLRSLLAASLAILPAVLPAGPAALEPDSLARFDRDTQAAAVDASAKGGEIEAQLAVTATQSARADTELASFLRDAALTTVLAEAAPAAVKAPAPAADETFDPGPGGTRVLADGGMFFDTAKGILVYLKNIRLSDPRFDLSCTDELKVFLAKEATPAGKKPAGSAPKSPATNPPATGAAETPPTQANPATTGTKPPATTPPTGEGKSPPATTTQKAATTPNASPNLLGGDFGDIDRLVATGSVRVVRKDPRGQATTATADTATYEATSGDVILRGGFPTVRKGKDYLRALEPGLYIRLYANGDVFAQPGKWETGVSDLNQKDKPAKPKPR